MMRTQRFALARIALVAASLTFACASSSTSDTGEDAAPRDAGHAVDSHDAGLAHEDASHDAETAPCGCNGKSGCAVWQNVFMTWYGYNDNSCGTEATHGCNDIADPGLGPKMHSGATAGAGTYDDPSTAAASDTMDTGHVYESADGVTLSPGTMIYNPVVQQYFIMEDSCLECGDEYACKLSSDDTDDPNPPSDCKVGTNLHIDFWMGPSVGPQPDSLDTCEDNATLGNPYAGIATVIVNPPSDLPVKPTVLYGSGKCFTSGQVSPVACP